MVLQKRVPVAAADHERQRLKQLERALSEANGEMLIATDTSGGSIELPGVVVELLHEIVGYLARGDAVTIAPLGPQISTLDAAQVLHVPVSYLINLLERGDIPSERTGSSFLLRREDALSYMRARDRSRGGSLQKLRELSEELGLYDLDIGPADVRNEECEEEERGVMSGPRA